MENFERGAVLVRTKRSWLFFLSIGVGVGALGPWVFLALHALNGHPSAWAGVALLFAAFCGLPYAWQRWWREERGALRADERGLWIGERCVVARSAIGHAYVMQHDGRTFVRLGRAHDLVDVEVADEAEGEAMLQAMRLDPSRSVGNFPMNHGTARGAMMRAAAFLLCVPFIAASPVVALVNGVPTAPVLASVLLWVAIVFAFARNESLRVSVGADGIHVRRVLGKGRFIPFSSIDDAETDGRDITLRLRDGETITMHHPTGKRHGTSGDPTDRELEGEKLVERIREQITAHRARVTADAAALARSGRETETWMREVSAVTEASATYRTPALPADELWRIVEDAAAPATARAGAAVALRQALDAGGRLRLRAVADACAGPRLRVALDAVASSEDDELRDALEPLDDHEEAPKKTLAR